MGSSRVGTAALGFLCGAATTCTLVVVYQLVQAKRRRRPTVTSSLSHWVGPSNTSLDRYDDDGDEEPLWDHPDLDLRLIRKAEAVIQGRTDAIVIVVERCTNDHNYSAILRTAEAFGIQSVYIIDPPAPTLVAEDGTVQIAASLANNTGALQDDTLETTTNDRSTMPLVRLTSESEKKAFADHRKFAQNATEWLTIREFSGATECLQSLRQDGYQVWVTDLSQEAVPLTVHGLQQHRAKQSTFTGHSSSSCGSCWPMPDKIALVMGTEAVGCSQEMLVGGDLRVYLPLVGFADSLNLSVATALVIQQVLHLSPQYAGYMSEANRHKLRQAWFPKLAQQRLLSSRGKKQRKALLKQIHICERLQDKLLLEKSTSSTNDADLLTAEQYVKLAKLPQYQEELIQLEAQSHFDMAEQSVADLIAHPPQPLTDVRRADPHRVTFVGKKTKRMHSDHWKDLVATTNTTTTLNATASFFRDRILPRLDKRDTSAK